MCIVPHMGVMIKQLMYICIHVLIRSMFTSYPEVCNYHMLLYTCNESFIKIVGTKITFYTERYMLRMRYIPSMHRYNTYYVILQQHLSCIHECALLHTTKNRISIHVYEQQKHEASHVLVYLTH